MGLGRPSRIRDVDRRSNLCAHAFTDAVGGLSVPLAALVFMGHGTHFRCRGDDRREAAAR